jgi:hypothetical protein
LKLVACLPSGLTSTPLCHAPTWRYIPSASTHGLQQHRPRLPVAPALFEHAASFVACIDSSIHDPAFQLALRRPCRPSPRIVPRSDYDDQVGDACLGAHLGPSLPQSDCCKAAVASDAVYYHARQAQRAAWIGPSRWSCCSASLARLLALLPYLPGTTRSLGTRIPWKACHHRAKWCWIPRRGWRTW